MDYDILINQYANNYYTREAILSSILYNAIPCILLLMLLIYRIIKFARTDKQTREIIIIAKKKIRLLRYTLVLLPLILIVLYVIFIAMSFNNNGCLENSILIARVFYMLILVEYCSLIYVIKRTGELLEKERNTLLKHYSGIALYFVLVLIVAIVSTTIGGNIVVTSTQLVKKPIIYIYPEEEQEVKVKLSNAERLVYSYPKYNGEWKVIASPNGNLYDNTTGRNYYGLYWEGKSTTNIDLKKGFVFKGEDTISFLEEKLEILGLNEREAEEFIIYWLPLMESNEYNYVYFKTIDEINREDMELHILPKPDTLIRIIMVIKPLNKYIEVEEQKLDQVIRDGYTVVEWGGMLI